MNTNWHRFEALLRWGVSGMLMMVIGIRVLAGAAASDRGTSPKRFAEVHPSPSGHREASPRTDVESQPHGSPETSPTQRVDGMLETSTPDERVELTGTIRDSLRSPGSENFSEFKAAIAEVAAAAGLDTDDAAALKERLMAAREEFLQADLHLATVVQQPDGHEAIEIAPDSKEQERRRAVIRNMLSSFMEAGLVQLVNDRLYSSFSGYGALRRHVYVEVDNATGVPAAGISIASFSEDRALGVEHVYPGEHDFGHLRGLVEQKLRPGGEP